MTITDKQAADLRAKFDAAYMPLIRDTINVYLWKFPEKDRWESQKECAWIAYRAAALEAAEAARECVVSDEVLDKILDRTVCEGEDVRFHLLPACTIDSDIENAAECERLLMHEVLRTILSAALSSAEQPSTGDDPHEFGAGIVQSPGARYWQKRSAEWMARAVALGWREHRDACQEAGVNPDDFAATAPGAPEADERDAFHDELIRLGYRRDRNAAGEYVGTAANFMWMGWQARAQSSAAPSVAPVSARDVVADALRPFADVGQWLFARNLPDTDPVVDMHFLNGVSGALTRGHFKAAHIALQALAAPPADARDGEAARRYRRISHALSTGDAELYDTRLIANDRVHDLDIDSFADGLPPADRAMGGE